MLHRVFTAINFPEDIKEKLFSFSKKYPQLPGLWVNKENIHITLNFLGNLDDTQLLDTINSVKTVSAKHSPFLLRINRICFGPANKFPPRMVWAIAEKSQPFLSLQGDLEKHLFDLPSYQYKMRENRHFSPHITLARIKSFEFRRLGQELKINEEVDFSFEASSIEVMESELKRSGPEYTILGSAELI